MYLICSFSGVTSQILHWTLKTPQYLTAQNSYTDQCVCLRKKNYNAAIWRGTVQVLCLVVRIRAEFIDPHLLLPSVTWTVVGVNTPQKYLNYNSVSPQNIQNYHYTRFILLWKSAFCACHTQNIGPEGSKEGWDAAPGMPEFSRETPTHLKTATSFLKAWNCSGVGSTTFRIFTATSPGNTITTKVAKNAAFFSPPK